MMDKVLSVFDRVVYRAYDAFQLSSVMKSVIYLVVFKRADVETNEDYKIEYRRDTLVTGKYLNIWLCSKDKEYTDDDIKKLVIDLVKTPNVYYARTSSYHAFKPGIVTEYYDGGRVHTQEELKNFLYSKTWSELVVL